MTGLASTAKLGIQRQIKGWEENIMEGSYTLRTNTVRANPSFTKKLCAQVVIWFVGEVLLNLIGLDTLADYGEFLLGHNANPQLVEPPAICLLMR